eukprot:TRINITY_DN29073_c0_g1_i1.p1 TRINITY_DN29073_c0_g1~~TRINITY_DN29073_c0_g1_i1.p1  ORF type:complete len:540 (-),score=94.46 TRINITY_DN29073_c0_g1_i1:16-1635(-)
MAEETHFVGASEFKKLLRALSDQYDKDLVEATRHGGSETFLKCWTQTTSDSVGEPQTGQLRLLSTDDDMLLPSQVESPRGEKTHSQPGPANAPQKSEPSSTLRLPLNDAPVSQLTTKSKGKKKEPETWLGRFVQSSLFDRVSAAVLVANAIFIGVQVEFMFKARAPVAIEALDYLFCVFFFVELVLSFCGFGCRHFWLDLVDRSWNVFDFFVVVVSTIDACVSIASRGAASPLGNISVLRIIRVVRITRVLRVFRIMKFFKDLRVMLAAIVSTVKTAYFALVLIFMIMYMFAVAITQMVAEHVKEREEANNPVGRDDDLLFFFGSIPESLMALFMTLAGGIDWKDAAVALYQVGWLCVVVYCIFVIIMTLCILNVLTGIFCQCAIEAAALDKDSIIMFQLQERERYIETLQSLFHHVDESGDGMCSLDEFKAHLSDMTMQALLNSLEIEVNDALTLFEMLDADGSGEVNLDEFVTGCITLRGSAKAVQIEKLQTMSRSAEIKQDELIKTVEHLASLIASESRKVEQAPGVSTETAWTGN